MTHAFHYMLYGYKTKETPMFIISIAAACIKLLSIDNY